MLVELLSGDEYAICPADSGEMALASVASRLPDLCLLDIRMPGIDGYEVCRQLKANSRTKDLPVIFISALGDLEDRLAGFRAGGIDFISKPFSA